MAFSKQSEQDMLERAQQDMQGGINDMIMRRLREDIRPSFDNAYHRMSSEGKPGLFLLKTGSVGLGCALMADGAYHMVSGYDERVEDLFLHSETTRNYVRIFAGTCEMTAGLMMAYLGAVKGQHR